MKRITHLFEGRVNRRNLAAGLISSVTFLFVSSILLTALDGGNLSGIGGLLFIVILISVLVLNISLFVRRWHDLGSTGWAVFLNFVPYVSIFVFLYVLFKEGKPEENKYGEAPVEDMRFPQDILGI